MGGYLLRVVHRMADLSAAVQVLHADQAETAARLERLQADLDGIVEASALVATDDEHDPEGATIAFERGQVIALIEQGRRHLVELDRALARVAEGTYGVCSVCGGPIAPERLEARPAATTCIACAAGGRRV